MTVYKSFMDFTEEDMLAKNLGELVHTGCVKNTGRDAFSVVLPTGHSASISYDRLDFLSDCLAAFLRDDLGLKPGDVVAIQSPNALSYPIVAFGTFKSGITITNVNPLYTVDETNHQLKDSGAKVWFVVDLFADKVEEAVKDTNVEQVYSLSLLDGFPGFKRSLLHMALKYGKKMIPEFTVPVAGNLKQVLKRGKKALSARGGKADYWKDVDADSLAIFQYTGGTTGRSKGAELSHRNVVSNISQGHKANKGVMDEGKHTMMLLLPLYHVYALAVGAMASLHSGTHVVLVPSPRPLSNLQPVFSKFPISVMPGVNTLYIGLMQEKWFTDNPPASLQFCFSGAAPLQPNTAKEWIDLTGAKIFEGYGLTEGTCMVSLSPLNQEPRTGTCGRAAPGTELMLVDEDGNSAPKGEPGELWVRGPQIMQGYLNRPEATAETISEDGWLKTGDVAVIDDDGWLKIVDRMKDMIIVSGFNVYPTDIEDVLTNHPFVADAAVVGVNSASKGEKIVAYVIKGNDALTESELRAHCREHLTGYKIPSIFAFIEELPKSPVGKVLRRTLRDQAKATYE